MVGTGYTPEQLAEASDLKIGPWMLQNEIKTSDGLPFEFEKRRFARAMMSDLSPKQVWFKPPQIGASEMTFCKVCFVVKKLRKNAIYTLPTQSDVQDMVGGKFNRIIAQNPTTLGAWTADHDTIEQKTLGGNTLYLRGTIGKTEAMMVSSSLNVHDELDHSDPQKITQYETRQEAQETEDDKWRWMFSHPSLSGHGVDIYWQLSDQKEWHIECPHCKVEQVLTWPDNIDMEREIYVCSSCHAELSDDTRIYGRWINKDGIPWEGKVIGGYEYSGFHVSQLMLFNKSAPSIIKAFHDPLKDKQYFYNYVLGLPYIESENRIEPSVVLRNCVDVVNEQTGLTIIGADTSHGINYVLGNKDGVFFYDREEEITASKDPYDVIRGYLYKFERSKALFDQGGDLIGVRKLQAEFPGRVFLCFYRKDRKTTEIVQWGEGEKYGEVYVDRNRMMTLVIEQLRDTGRIRLNGTKDEWREFAQQFDNIYREEIKIDSKPDKDDASLYASGTQYVWKRNGHDDYVHALIYFIVCLQKYGGDLAHIGNASNFSIGQSVKPRMMSKQLEGRIVDPWAAEVDPSPIMRAEGSVEL